MKDNMFKGDQFGRVGDSAFQAMDTMGSGRKKSATCGTGKAKPAAAKTKAKPVSAKAKTKAQAKAKPAAREKDAGEEYVLVGEIITIEY